MGQDWRRQYKPMYLGIADLAGRAGVERKESDMETWEGSVNR